ncbi:site-specific integrase [Vibrio sp. 1CM2L]|uniref:tyrosine-type recombinase/integrase n=1 Tax=Vibrio sp. 1CM2L TaxID=2929166 RepID=UPI0020C0A716|nr:site-specific integrase [Vibrio sp. 1CM2L]MCK8078334.1 site-specific integrase [Vibrio sp. 1CM2L]
MSKSSKLTATKIESLSKTKPVKVTRYRDGEVDGLSVIHRVTGTVSFVLRYRISGKASEINLGSYDKVTLTLKDAREKANSMRRLISEGGDPKVQRKLNRDKASTEKTVRAALEYWLDNEASKTRKNADKHKAQFERHVYPHIGSLPLSACETQDWVAVFDAITSGKHTGRPAPKASGYVLQNCKQAIKYCRVRGFAKSHALDDLLVKHIGESQDARERILTKAELKSLWMWTHDERQNSYYTGLIRLLVVFGCRSQELRLSKVSEWDLDTMVWTTPKENSKTNVEIARPIPEQVRPLIESLIERSRSNYLLSELKSPEAVSMFGRGLHKRLEHDNAWSLHDIRRTFATMLNDLEVEPYVVEQMLGHSLGGVMKIYNRSQHIPQKRVALSVWMNELEGLCNE